MGTGANVEVPKEVVQLAAPASSLVSGTGGGTPVATGILPDQAEIRLATPSPASVPQFVPGSGIDVFLAGPGVDGTTLDSAQAADDAGAMHRFAAGTARPVLEQGSGALVDLLLGTHAGLRQGLYDLCHPDVQGAHGFCLPFQVVKLLDPHVPAAASILRGAFSTARSVLDSGLFGTLLENRPVSAGVPTLRGASSIALKAQTPALPAMELRVGVRVIIPDVEEGVRQQLASPSLESRAMVGRHEEIGFGSASLASVRLETERTVREIAEAAGDPIRIDRDDRALLAGGAHAPISRSGPAFGFWSLALSVLLLSILAPFLHRIRSQSELLSHPFRQAAYDLLLSEPGLTAGQLANRLGGSRITARYHLLTLLRHELLVAERVGNRLEFFPNGQKEPSDVRRMRAVLRTESARRLVSRISNEPDASVRSLARATGLAPSGVHWHLRRLVREGVLVREPRGKYRPGAQVGAVFRFPPEKPGEASSP